MSLTGTVPMRGQSPKYRLAFLTDHPIQYQAPFFRKLADSPQIDLQVYFCSTMGLGGKMDPEFGLSVKWDVPLLNGYPHVFLDNLSPLRNSQKFWSYFNPSVIREIRTQAYDAVVVHGYGNATHWLAMLAARRQGIPIIFHGETVLHENRNRILSLLKNRLLRRAFRDVASFLYIGTRSREFYKAFGVPDEKLFLSPYSVDNDFFMRHSQALKLKKKELRRDLGIRDSAPVILYASKLIERKRPLDLLQAFEPLQDKVSLIFVGDGQLREVLKARVDSKGLRNVFFAGFQNQTQLPKYYAAADLFVLPSEFETWGLAINEAMCFGLPILTTTGVAAAADLVIPGENGFVYEPGDLPVLSDLLRRLTSDQELLEKQGKRSLEIISSWNHEKCLQGVLEALHFAVPRKRNRCL